MQRKRQKVKGWSTEEMKDKANSLLEKDTEEMRTLRALNQEEIDQCWKKLAEKMVEEVLDKYKVEDCKREAYKGRGSLLDWRRVRRSKNTGNESGEKIAGQESSLCSECTTCSVAEHA